MAMLFITKKMKKTKYIYFFRGSLTTHVGIYKSWVDLARANNIPMEMLTILNWKTYLQQKEKVNYYKKFDYIKILKSPHSSLNIFIISLYLLLLYIKYKKIIIHLRKQDATIFDKLKYVLRNSIKYIIEIEGDFQSEVQYLKEHPFKQGFYNNIFQVAENHIEVMRQNLKNADHVLVVTKNLKNLLIKRYPEFGLKNKISVIPTGADINKFYYDENLRKKYRKKLNIIDNFVFIFTGNVYYSWQNLKRSLEVFNLVKKHRLFKNPFILLLIRKQDFYIAEDLIKKVSLRKSDYLLTNANHDEVNAYLNAADIGVLFRDDHIMNHVSSPGKLGEYLAAGLPVLISKRIANYSEKVRDSDYGVVLNNFYDDNEILSKAKRLNNDSKRNERSRWAKGIFSVQAYQHIYVNLLKKLSK